MKHQNKNNLEKGVSLVITFFVMMVILAIVLSVSALLYNEIKLVRNIGNSVAGFYAAESGIEKVLFFDRQVFPTLQVGKTAKRGLCTMYLYDADTNFDACAKAGDVDGSSLLDQSVFCNNGITPALTDPVNHPDGCNSDICDNCKISFNTSFENKAYYVTASISDNGDSSDFKIDSRGVYPENGGSSRQIEVLMQPLKPKDIIDIKYACANPKSTPQGESIDIIATIGANNGDTIKSVTAKIRNASGNVIASNLPLGLVCDGTLSAYNTCQNGQCNIGCGVWKYTWQSGSNQAQSYFVDIDVIDNSEARNERPLESIPPCAGI